MNISVLSRITAAVLGLLMLQWAAPAFAQGISVEQAQRDFQARHHLIKGTYVEWPKCSAASETPAPHFPKDGFYGDLLRDPDKGVELVKDLVEKFYHIPANEVYTAFVKPPSGQSEIEGATTIENYDEADMQVILTADVTAENYMDKLYILAAELGKLRLVKVSADQIIAGDDTKMSFSQVNSVNDPLASCTTVANCTISAHSAQPLSGWGYLRQYGWSGCSTVTWERSIPTPGYECLDFPSRIARVLEVTAQYAGAYPPAGYAHYYAAVRNTRGRIRADLSDYKKGTANVFLKLSKISCDDAFTSCWDHDYELNFSCQSVFAQLAPTSAPENTFGKWTQGTLTLGAVSTSGYVTHSDASPVAMGNCEQSEVTTVYGWSVVEATVIVTPDFTTTPDPQDCCACSDCEPGSLTATLPSVHVNIPLGSDNYGGSAGALTLSAETPSAALATLTALRHSVAGTVEVIPTSNPGSRRQFKTSQALFDIQENNSYKYTISVYNAANSGAKDGSGFYQPTGPASSTIVVENPEASPTIYNSLKITRTKDGNSSITEYVYSPANGQWELTTGGGLRRESRASVWTGQDLRTETVTVKNSANQIVFKEINAYTRFPWGQERTQQVADSDGAALTSTWSFYSNPLTDGGNYGRLKEEVGAYGHWARFEYDSNGRETKRVSQFLNSAVGSAENLNRVVTTSYSTSDPQITTIEKLLGQEIGRRYQIVHSGEVRDIVCQTPGANWNAADNLVTITKKYTSGTFEDELQSVENADGTMQIYAYAINAGTRTETVDSGQPNGAKTAIVDGTRTVTIKGSVGQMISRTVTDIASAITLSTETYSNYDEFNRPQRVTYLDGTYSDTQYGCCGVESTTDRDGVVTQYLYDDLKRQDGYIRHGITFRNTLDAEGRVLVQKRIGTDSSEIILTQTTYDVTGRVSTEINGLSGTTSHVEGLNGSGQRVKTTTYPDSGTRVETYNKDGSLEKVTGTAVFGVRYDYGVGSDGAGGLWRAYRMETKLEANGIVTAEWTKSYIDLLGRNYKTVHSDFMVANETDNPYSQAFYNSAGQLSKQRDPDGVIALNQYNAKGELEYAVLDLNANSAIDFGGPDRVTRTVADVVANYSTSVRRTRDYVYPSDGSSTALLVSTAETFTDGLRTWQTVYRDASTPVVTQTQTAYNNNDGVTATGYRTITVTHPDSSKTVSVQYQGRPLSVARKSSSNTQITKTTSTYDTHGRLWKTTDARNGTSTYSYNAADQLVTATTPVPGAGQAVQTTTTHYNTSLRAWKITQPDNTDILNEYYASGLLKKTYGSRNYPVEYTYDGAGRMKTMKTWKDFATDSGSATTTWNYDPYHGGLANKRHPDSTGPDYTYTAGGRVKTRSWARLGTGAQRIVTTYKYGFDDGTSGNDHGDLVQVSYANDPQSTPTVTTTYDRQGRQKTATHGSATTTLTYNDANQLLAESYSGGTLNGVTITSGFDTYLRRTSLSLNTQPSAINHTYAYDNAACLQTVSDGTYNATYSYLANSPLVEQIAFKQNSTVRMTTTKQYDFLNRLTSISSINPQPSTLNSFSYTYNDANQRLRATFGDGSYWLYEYDSLGQVKSGKKYWGDGTLVAGQQFEYTHDDIGNREATKAGGDQTGAGLRTANYSANSLNQYTSHDVPGTVDVMGIAFATATVTVNSQVPYRKGEYFRKELSVANGSAAVWQSVSVAATGETTVNGNVFVQKTPEAFAPDLDGNLLTDGRWTYTWDAENRLLQVESLGSAPTVSKRKVAWEYDCRGRRIRQTTYEGSSGSYAVTEDLKFVSDGWRHIAELNAANNSLLRSYVWGLDLGGSLDRAGGVGGLLMLNSVANGVHFYGYDGNGNVSMLAKGTDGTVSARYEYSPFGELLRITGQLANENRFCFSTKRCDRTTDLVLYEYRAYSTSLGRWLSRDPIGELGGGNLYGFVKNHPVNSVDVLGFYEEDGHFYATYMGAVAAGYSPDNAFQLAFYSQLPDEVAFLSAFDTVGGHVHSRLHAKQWLKDVQQLLHSLHGGDVAKRRDCLAKLLKEPSLAIWERGLLIHAFGDSYAHTYQAGRAHKDYAHSYPYGHASTGDGGHAPDIIANRPKLFQQYAKHLFDVLNTGGGNMKKLEPLLQTAGRLPKDESLRYEWMRRLAEQRYGYNSSYQPELGMLYDNNNPTKFDQRLHIPTREEAQKLLDKIKCCK